MSSGPGHSLVTVSWAASLGRCVWILVRSRLDGMGARHLRDGGSPDRWWGKRQGLLNQATMSRSRCIYDTSGMDGHRSTDGLAFHAYQAMTGLSPNVVSSGRFGEILQSAKRGHFLTFAISAVSDVALKLARGLSLSTTGIGLLRKIARNGFDF